LQIAGGAAVSGIEPVVIDNRPSESDYANNLICIAIPE
jgi:hypothetical protein